jgi:hypothetical protein
VSIEVTPIVSAGAQFGRPFVDVDEYREDPRHHRYVHGGFEGTTTRFALYFPPQEVYQGRFLQNPGANLDGPGNESLTLDRGIYGGLDMAFEAGAYLVSSVPFGGYDSEPGDTSYAIRATAAAALQSRQIAEAIYGESPHHGYIWGGSGGGARTLDCMEHIDGVWDGAVPYMTGGRMISGLPDIFAWAYSAQVNVRRILGSKIESVIDALEPGGSGNPYEGLSEDQRREVAAMMQIGYPRGAEFLLRDPTADVALWTWRAREFVAEQPDYFARFWTEPGYAGHDRPDLLAEHLLDDKATVTRVLTGNDLADPEAVNSLAGKDGALFVAGIPVRLSMMAGDMPIAVLLDQPLHRDAAGARISVSSGEAVGRTLYAMAGGGPILIASLTGAEEALLGFTNVRPGDEIAIDNRDFLAYGFLYRHWGDNPIFEVDGVPVFPQHGNGSWPSAWGNDRTGTLHGGRVILIHHAQDPYVWPPGMVDYDHRVRAYLGNRTHDKYRFWFTERAEHLFPPMKDEGRVPVHSTRLINYTPVIEQAIHDLIAWCEREIPPADDTAFEVTTDNAVVLPPTGVGRRGIQPVVAATVNGAARADVSVGDQVLFEVRAETPPGTGTIIAVEWDMLGAGDWPTRDDAIDGTQSSVTTRTVYTFDAPGTYFPSVRVSSHREGNVSAPRRRVPNIARVRVVVR